MSAEPGLPIVFDAPAGPRRALRVAVVTETYPPEVNGVALTAMRFVEGLRERGHEVQLVRPAQRGELQGAGDADLLVKGAPIPRYPHLRMGFPAGRALLHRWSVDRPDVVHLVTEGPLGWSALRAAEKLRLPASSDFRTNFHDYSRHYGVGWLGRPILAYLRRFHNRTFATLVPTRTLRDELAQAGFRHLSVVSRGVDSRRFDPVRRSNALRASWGAGDRDLVALYVGRIAPEKNIEALVPALAAMRLAAPSTRLVCVGDGPARAAMQASLPDAIWAGQRSGDDLAAHFASADVFLFPSLTETFGNVVLEAMASGLAVVAFDRAAAGELVVHGRNGLVAPPGDTARFAALSGSLATLPSRIPDLSRRARARAMEHEWHHVVGEFEKVLRRVAANAVPEATLPAARRLEAQR